MNTVLFGAFDRHNLGDILLARIAGREAGGPVTFAGLVGRDLGAWGGPTVLPLAAAISAAPVRLIHVGGELLDCDAAQAACMLGEVALPLHRQCPYLVPKSALPAGSAVELRAVGGVALGERPADFRREVVAALAEADGLSVRDRVTRDLLADHGVSATLAVDPATRVAELFADDILQRRPAGRGHAAVQFAAEWGDDATLAKLARGLDRAGLPVILFRAGAAPWHDDLEPYRRLAARLRVPVRLFESLHVWDICALIAGATRFIGTSLHARIVADAFGVPALTLERRPGAARKQGAYLATWQAPPPVALDEFAGA